MTVNNNILSETALNKLGISAERVAPGAFAGYFRVLLNSLPLSRKPLNYEEVQCVVFFLLDDFPASEFYVRTFRNTLFHLHRTWTTYEDGIDRGSETSAHEI
jgi:hypothetical protein